MNDDLLGYQGGRDFAGIDSFSEARSFQMFVESLRELQSYEVDPAPAKLEKAATTLQQCVDEYPADVLPRFYLGMARTLQGYSGLNQAIDLFTEIIEAGPLSLRRAARYNLAAALVERYDADDFKTAEHNLRELASDIFRIDPGHQDPGLTGLLGQAYVLWAYSLADRAVWRPAKAADAAIVGAIRRGEGEAAEVAKLLKQAMAAADAPGVAAAVRTEIRADYWNVMGTLAESKAYINDDISRKYAHEALEAFQRALALRRNWIPPLSNMARVYQRLLGDLEAARRLWEKVLAVRPDDEYANYMLGKAIESKHPTHTRDSRLAAYRYYRKAPNIPKARERAAALESELEWWDRP